MIILDGALSPASSTPFWDWVRNHATIIIALLALIGTAAQIWVVIWIQNRQALARQRYEIITSLYKLYNYYLEKTGKHKSGQLYDITTIENEIKMSLYRPTIMKQTEFKKIFRVVSYQLLEHPMIGLSIPDEMKLKEVEVLYLEIEEKLRHNLAKIGNDTFDELKADALKQKEVKNHSETNS